MRSKKIGFIFSIAMLFVIIVVAFSPTMVVAFTIPDTGLTKCFNTNGTVIACAGTGQDGAYTGTAMSLTSNGNNIITDNVSKLMWQNSPDRDPDTNLLYSYNWYQASGTYDKTYNPTSQNVCGSITLGGYSDWRLPTIMEMLSIMDFTNDQPLYNENYFTNWYYAYDLWTSNSYGKDDSGIDQAFGVSFSYGGIFYAAKGSKSSSLDGREMHVRCVRGTTEPSPSFTDNGNGTVTDNNTKLVWQQEAEAGAGVKWADALTYCENLELGGQKDWRLPNIKELASIIDFTKKNPAIDTKYFLPQNNIYAYWTSTTQYINWKYGTGEHLLSAYATEISSGKTQAWGKQAYTFKSLCVRGGKADAVVATQNNCAASVSSSLVVHVPIVTYSGSNYWADLQYNSSTGQLTVANAGIVSDASSYSSCTASTLSSDFKLHIPVVMLSGVSYWLDLQYNGSVFTVAGAGQN